MTQTTYYQPSNDYSEDEEKEARALLGDKADIVCHLLTYTTEGYDPETDTSAWPREEYKVAPPTEAWKLVAECKKDIDWTEIEDDRMYVGIMMETVKCLVICTVE